MTVSAQHVRAAIVIALFLAVASCGGPGTRTPTPISTATDTTAPAPATAHGSPAAGQLEGLVAYVGGEDPQIYLLDLESGESRQLTQLGPEDAELGAVGPMRPALTCGFGPSGLQWAPDGSRLAFAYGGCDSVVHIVDLDGALQRIGDGRSPAWSPDGSRLAFGQNYPYLEPSGGESWPLLVVDIGGGDLTPRPVGDVVAGFHAAAPSYSPDGTRIAFTGPVPGGAADPMAFAAYVMAADGTDLALVARGASAVGWLADDTLLVVSATGQSAAVDLDTEESTPVAGGDAVEGVAPDGSLLGSSVVGGSNRVRLYDAGGELVGEVAGSAPTWSPDGSAFLVNDAESAVLLVIGVDGAELGRYDLVPPLGGDMRARWQPGRP